MVFFDFFYLIYIYKKKYMKTLHINDEIHEEFKKFCKNNGYQINRLTEIIIEDYLKRNKKR